MITLYISNYLNVLRYSLFYFVLYFVPYFTHFKIQNSGSFTKTGITFSVVNPKNSPK